MLPLFPRTGGQPAMLTECVVAYGEALKASGNRQRIDSAREVIERKLSRPEVCKYKSFLEDLLYSLDRLQKAA